MAYVTKDGVVSRPNKSEVLGGIARLLLVLHTIHIAQLRE